MGIDILYLICFRGVLDFLELFSGLSCFLANSVLDFINCSGSLCYCCACHSNFLWEQLQRFCLCREDGVVCRIVTALRLDRAVGAGIRVAGACLLEVRCFFYSSPL